MKFIFILGLNELELLDKFGYKDYFNSKGYHIKYELINDSNKSKTNNNLNFLDQFARFLYCVDKSNYTYSYYHAIFERISLKKPLKTILIQYIGRILRNNERLTIILRNCIENVRAFSLNYKKVINQDEKIYVFFNIISTSVELKYFYEAVRLNQKRILVQTYWDNISSKMYVPHQEFTKVICWGNESVKKYIEINNPSNTEFDIAFPYRCNYLKQINRNNINNIILYTPSQKKLNSDIDNLKTLDRVITKVNLLTDKNYSIVYRPHPYSSPNDIPDLRGYNHISIDPAFSDLAFSEFGMKNIPFANHKCFFEKSYNSLVNILSKTICLLSQSGTLCLEARSLSINVLVLLNEPYQVTLKLSHHMSHFNEIFSDKGVFPIYSQNQLEEFFESSNLIKKFPVSNFVKNSIVFNPILSEILEK
jgi:hypothetical protein